MMRKLSGKKLHRKHLSPFDPSVHALVTDSTLFAPPVEYIPGQMCVHKIIDRLRELVYLSIPGLPHLVFWLTDAIT